MSEGGHAAHRGQLEVEAKLVARWVGTNLLRLHGWTIDDDGVLVATVRIPLTPEELAEYRSLR